MLNEYFPYILLVHAVICYVYLLVNIRKKSIARPLFFLVFCLPFIGLILSLIIIAINTKNSKHEDNEEQNLINTIDVMFGGPDKAERFDVVALEEALMLNDHYVQRELINEAVKYDIMTYVNILKRARDTKDEITRDMVEKRLESIKHELREEYLAAKRNFSEAQVDRDRQQDLIISLDRIIRAGLEDSNTIQEANNERIKILARMILTHKTDNRKAFEDLINLLINDKDYEKAEEWLSLYERTNKEDEGMLICKLKLAYGINDKNAFDKAIEKMINADYVISEKTQFVVEYLCGWGNKSHKILNGSIS